jgi:hypothetical protein
MEISEFIGTLKERAHRSRCDSCCDRECCPGCRSRDFACGSLHSSGPEDHSRSVCSNGCSSISTNSSNSPVSTNNRADAHTNSIVESDTYINCATGRNGCAFANSHPNAASNTCGKPEAIVALFHKKGDREAPPFPGGAVKHCVLFYPFLVGLLYPWQERLAIVDEPALR